MDAYDRRAGSDSRHANNATRRKGMPGWAWGLIGAGGVVVILVLAVIGWFVYVVANSPDTFVYSGNQTPSRYIDTARDLGLVSESETVLFFYSDAMLDVEDAMYILTDHHLVLYNKEWPDPKKIIAFNEVVDVSATWSGDWIMDSTITVELNDGSLWTFPLSMEGGTDRRFVEKLCESAGVQTPP